MAYSSIPIVQSIGEILLEKQIQTVVLSPGSRNAPFIIHFSGHEQFQTHVIVDERSAGFFALGISQYIKKPVCLCCTSGTAVLNYAPVVAEAFYRQIPLIILSADRPEHLIDIADGQTIRQQGSLCNHILKEIHLLENSSLKEKQNQVNNILNCCIEKKGPIHINVPFSEPLYGVSDSIFVNPKTTLPISHSKESTTALHPFLTAWKESKRKMILIGMHKKSDKINGLFEKLTKEQGVVILTENTSNMHSDHFFSHIDRMIFFMNKEEWRQYAPDFLLTIGTNIISKRIKHILRSIPIAHHAHANSLGVFPDTYNQLTFRLKNKLKEILNQILSYSKNEIAFTKKWNERKEESQSKHQSFLENITYSDLSVFELLMRSLPKNSILHLGNSSIARYAQLFKTDETIDVYSNRGTSGIEGSMSTALGTAISSNRQNVLIIGDLSFFYDSNALMIKNIPSDFRIIVINNGGGGIFQFIPGPDSIPNHEETFIATHSFSASHLCVMAGMDFQTVDNINDLQSVLNSFFKKSNKPQLVEIKTNGSLSAEILKNYFRKIKGTSKN